MNRVATGGYNGFSMSNRAVTAYEQNEKPLSKWSLSSLLEQIAEIYGQDLAYSVRGYGLKRLREIFLTKSSWHHTSKFYNRTDFFEIDPSLSVTEEAIWQDHKINYPKPHKPDLPTDSVLDKDYGYWTEYELGPIRDRNLDIMHKEAADKKNAGNYNLELDSYNAFRLGRALSALMVEGQTETVKHMGTFKKINGKIYKKELLFFE